MSALESACGALAKPWDMKAASGTGTKCKTVKREMLCDYRYCEYRFGL